MKKLILIILTALLIGLPSYSKVQKIGNTFMQTPKEQKAPKKTNLVYQDSKGVKYPIYISDKGSCFVIKISQKTKKEYRQYLGKEVSLQICQELGIEYKGKK